MNNLESVIRTVRRLLALSKSSNANESAAAIAKANELIDRYRISVADLSEDEDPLIKDETLISGKIAAWRKQLARELRIHYGCYSWYRSGCGVTRIMLAGRKSDVEIVKYLFAYLSSECVCLMPKRGRVERASFAYGFVKGVGEQLMRSRAAMKHEHGPSALVKLDSRAAMAELAVTGGKKHRKARGVAITIDESARMAGMRAGQAVHLGSALEGKSTTKLIGD